MKFLEEEMLFTEKLDLQKSQHLKEIFHTKAFSTLKNIEGESEVIGIKMRIGNEPIVRNLKRLLELSNAVLPPETQILFEKSDIYTIVHGVGAIRTEGRADVDEIQYHAEVIGMDDAQTIDLIPNTRFKEVLKANVNFEGAMTASGNVSGKVPPNLLSTLTQKYISLGGDMQIQLSANANFVGKFTYSLKFPVVHSIGIASNKCSWVLNPDEDKTPLLGDQLLVQTIAVPKGTTSMRMKLHGVLKVDRGLFWKHETKSTKPIEVSLNLS